MIRSPEDEAFFKVVENMYYDVLDLRDLEPIDDVKDLLLAMLKEHIAALNDLGMLDEANHDEAMQVAANLINRDFMNFDRLKLNNEIIAAGDTVFLVVAPDDERESLYYDLSGGHRLRGAVGRLLVEQIPHENALIPATSTPNRSSESDPEALLPQKANEFGLLLELVDASYLDSDGDELELPQDALVLLPLNYSQLRLKKFIE